MRAGVTENEQQLRCLAMNDESSISSFLGLRLESSDVATLGAKTTALVRLGALVGADAAPATLQWAVEAALAAGARDEEVIRTLVAVAPIVGLASVVSAAPDVAIALGYPVESALELISDPA
jgi:alkylhydroperoxidase/carboxymuconolactone decarboxylase family protein YurZ